MDSAPYLQTEDRLDYKRILEELLHDEQVRYALRRAPRGPNAEQLHTLALQEAPTVAATAAAEYGYFLELREQARRTTPVPDWERLGGDDPAQWQEPESALVAAGRAGVVPLIAVLLPILSGLSALVLLILGYGMRADSIKLGQPLVTAGLVAAVICVAAIAVDIIGLVLTAARDSATPPSGRNPELYAELAKAREAWHTTLRERALLPFLLAQLGTVPRPRGPRPPGVSLVRARPRLGFSSPGFTSPAAERFLDDRYDEWDPEEPESHYSSPGFTSPGTERPTEPRSTAEPAEVHEPRFSSPGFTSPGPERLTDERGEEVEPSEESEPHFSSPGYSSPSFASPDFASPDFVSQDFVSPKYTGPQRTGPQHTGRPTAPEPATPRPTGAGPTGPGTGTLGGQDEPAHLPRPRTPVANGTRGNRFLPNADDGDGGQEGAADADSGGERR